MVLGSFLLVRRGGDDKSIPRLSEWIVLESFYGSNWDDGHYHQQTRVGRVVPTNSYRKRVELSRGPHTLQNRRGKVVLPRDHDVDLNIVITDDVKSKVIILDDTHVHVQTDTKFYVLANTEVMTQTNTNVLVQADTDVGFLGGSSDPTLLTGYSNHVAFRLWQREV